jgi:hypothetical protein
MCVNKCLMFLITKNYLRDRGDQEREHALDMKTQKRDAFNALISCIFINYYTLYYIVGPTLELYF